MIILGNEYNSITECCKKLGVNYNTVMQAVFRGKELDDVIQGLLDKRIVIYGKKYNTLREVYETFNVKPHILKKVMKEKGYTNKDMEKAIEECKNVETNSVMRDVIVTVTDPITDEVLTVPVSQACKILDVSYNTVYSRIKKDGMSPEEALMGGVRTIIIDGLIYNNLKECCNMLDVSYTGARELIKNGFTAEEAVNVLREKGDSDVQH